MALAARPTASSKPPAVEYYVVKDVPEGNLGPEHPIYEKGGSLRVMMNAAQARYWLDQGIIATVTKEKIAERAEARKQVAKEATSALAEVARTAPPVEETPAPVKARPARLRDPQPGRGRRGS